jgi:imidazole glycerol-phosphate synthase subunit HisH
MIVVIDSGICNLTSVVLAFERVGAPIQIAATPGALSEASAIVLPGVGAFGDGMSRLRGKGMVDPILRAARESVPVFGICLGMQLLVEGSEEHGRHQGLGLLPGRAVRLSADQPGFRVPNMGWCDVTANRPGVLFPAGWEPAAFYFVHSYHVLTSPECVAATISFSGRPIAVSLEKDNVFGVQFHPEKSQDSGLDLLNRWVGHLRSTGRISA